MSVHVVAEMALTGNALADKDRFVQEIIDQITEMKLEDETRALTKEDLVKCNYLLAIS